MNANACPESGNYCLSVQDNVDNARRCSAASTKQECVSLMKQFPCVWDPRNNLPNSNYIDVRTMQFVGERIRTDSLEKIQTSLYSQPEVLRFDGCDLVYTFNVRKNSIFDEFESASYFSSPSVIDESAPTFYNDKHEVIKNIGLFQSYPPRPYRLFFYDC